MRKWKRLNCRIAGIAAAGRVFAGQARNGGMSAVWIVLISGNVQEIMYSKRLSFGIHMHGGAANARALASDCGRLSVLPASVCAYSSLGEVETGMSYEMSDKIILQGELMKYRRSLCEKIAKYGGICKKCPAHHAGKCAISIVIKSLNE